MKVSRVALFAKRSAGSPAVVRELVWAAMSALILGAVIGVAAHWAATILVD